MTEQPTEEEVARILHEMGLLWHASMEAHEPFGECFCSDARREDARDFLARLTEGPGFYDDPDAPGNDR